jgi:hypothetical protein
MKRIVMVTLALAMAGGGLLAWIGIAVGPLEAQAVISADGEIESKAVGLVFPDGTVQAVASSSAPASVEDTGQKSCWNADGASIPCASTGQDGAWQRGVAWPTPRFTDNNDGTVTDNLTGLVWLENANCFGSRIWTDALADANGLMAGQCGLSDGSLATDWRLPNANELLSLADYSESEPALSAGHPFAGVQVATPYWSSSTSLPTLSTAWSVYMNFGYSSYNGAKSNSYYVWPVRNGQ